MPVPLNYTVEGMLFLMLNLKSNLLTLLEAVVAGIHCKIGAHIEVVAAAFLGYNQHILVVVGSLGVVEVGIVEDIVGTRYIEVVRTLTGLT